MISSICSETGTFIDEIPANRVELCTNAFETYPNNIEIKKNNLMFGQSSISFVLYEKAKPFHICSRYVLT